MQTHVADGPLQMYGYTPDEIPVVQVSDTEPGNYTDITVQPHPQGRIVYGPRPEPYTEVETRGIEDFLEFERQPQYLRWSNVGSSYWLGRPGQCSKNLTSDWHPFVHPDFVFNVPIQALRVRMRKLPEKKPFWDAIYMGPPGNDYTVPSYSTPGGGKKPLFPEFCPPIKPNSKWELRLTHITRGLQQFDEKLTLRPKRKLPLRVVSGPANGLGGPVNGLYRPYETLLHRVDGAVKQRSTWMDQFAKRVGFL